MSWRRRTPEGGIRIGCWTDLEATSAARRLICARGARRRWPSLPSLGTACSGSPSLWGQPGGVATPQESMEDKARRSTEYFPHTRTQRVIRSDRITLNSHEGRARSCIPSQLADPEPTHSSVLLEALIAASAGAPQPTNGKRPESGGKD